MPYVNEHGEIAPCPNCQERDEEIEGLIATVKEQARRMAKYERELKRYAEAEEHHPHRKEILELIDYWRKATGHERSKASKDRVDLIKARLKDGYSFDQIRLAVDGLAAFPYVRDGRRVASGKPSERFDQLKHALKGGQELERFAVLGYQANQQKEKNA